MFVKQNNLKLCSLLKEFKDGSGVDNMNATSNQQSSSSIISEIIKGANEGINLLKEPSISVFCKMLGEILLLVSYRELSGDF